MRWLGQAERCGLTRVWSKPPPHERGRSRGWRPGPAVRGRATGGRGAPPPPERSERALRRAGGRQRLHALLAAVAHALEVRVGGRGDERAAGRGREVRVVPAHRAPHTVRPRRRIERVHLQRVEVERELLHAAFLEKVSRWGDEKRLRPEYTASRTSRRSLPEPVSEIDHAKDVILSVAAALTCVHEDARRRPRALAWKQRRLQDDVLYNNRSEKRGIIPRRWLGLDPPALKGPDPG